MATEAQATTRRDLETALIEKCWKDPEFKKQVVSDPRGMLEKHTGQKLPPQVNIFIHEEDANTLHFSIPPAPANLNELSDEDLERVAGGTDIVVTTVLIGTAQLAAWTVAAAATAAASAAATAGGVLAGTGAW
jgi:hypothetical protein